MQFQIVGPAPDPRFRTPAEIVEDSLNRVTPKDVANRINKLRSDIIVATHNIDKALAAPTRPNHRTAGRVEHRYHGPIEYSGNVGRVLGVR